VSAFMFLSFDERFNWETFDRDDD